MYVGQSIFCYSTLEQRTSAKIFSLTLSKSFPLFLRSLPSVSFGVTTHPVSGVPRNFFFGGGGGSTNSVEDRGQREWGSGGIAP